MNHIYKSYYNLSLPSVRPASSRPFLDRRAPNLVRRWRGAMQIEGVIIILYGDIEFYVRESGWEPHWQGASI